MLRKVSTRGKGSKSSDSKVSRTPSVQQSVETDDSDIDFSAVGLSETDKGEPEVVVVPDTLPDTPRNSLRRRDSPPLKQNGGRERGLTNTSVETPASRKTAASGDEPDTTVTSAATNGTNTSESAKEADNLTVSASRTGNDNYSLIDAGSSYEEERDEDDISDSYDGPGYAVASSKRNAEFHALFKSIPSDDYLVEDFGCVLQREILVRGRLYVSEHHVLFYANIFGWITRTVIPFSHIISIEKKMTALVIPNAIEIATLHSRQVFSSFLSRDSTYDLIVSLWRVRHPASTLPAHDADDADKNSIEPVESGAIEAESQLSPGLDSATPEPGSHDVKASKTASAKERRNAPIGKPTRRLSDGRVVLAGRESFSNQQHRITQDTSPVLADLDKVCMDSVFPTSPEKVYNLLFLSPFMRDFLASQRLTSIQISDWAMDAESDNHLSRHISYIKPLDGPVGPKQTKCNITDENIFADFDDFILTVTTTETPDVPSGNAFKVKTRTSFTWAKNNSCRVRVTTGVEWTKSSFLKGVIERSCIDGQTQYHQELKKAMLEYMNEHRGEFLEQGHYVDEDVTQAVESGDADLRQEKLAEGKYTDNAPSNDVVTQTALPIQAFLHGTIDLWNQLTSSLPSSVNLTSTAFTVLIVLLLLNLQASSRPRSINYNHYHYATKWDGSIEKVPMESMFVMDWSQLASVADRKAEYEHRSKQQSLDSSLNELIDDLKRSKPQMGADFNDKVRKVTSFAKDLESIRKEIDSLD